MLACWAGEESLMQWTWSSDLPINILELRVLWRIPDENLFLYFEHAMAMTYINHQGGTRIFTTQEIVKLILSWAELCCGPAPHPHFRRGDFQAAFLSYQHLNPGGKALYQEGFQALCHRWGISDVDLLASRISKLNKFLARSRDPQAFTMDALFTLQDQIGPVNLYLFSTKVFPLFALQKWDGAHSGDTHCNELAQKKVVLGHTRIPGRLSMGHCSSSGLSVSMIGPLSCFSVACFKDMTVV